MKRKLLTLIMMVAFGVSSIGGLASASTRDYGSTAAKNDDSYTLEEMLTYAIQDEYMAQTEYQEIITTLNADLPFTNIVAAEQSHINQLQALIMENGFTVPLNEADHYLTVPGNLLDAYKAGAAAEVNNIAMYAAFLSEDLPADVRVVFTSLKSVSEQHLQAFERKDSRADGTGLVSPGQGRQNGQGQGQGGFGTQYRAGSQGSSVNQRLHAYCQF